ncbi:hypothetical protein SK128_026578, partial [Halocaridina rubra]
IWLLPKCKKLNDTHAYKASHIISVDDDRRVNVEKILSDGNFDYSRYLIYNYYPEESFVSHYIFTVRMTLSMCDIDDSYATWRNIAYCLFNIARKMSLVDNSYRVEDILFRSWLGYSAKSKKFNRDNCIAAWDKFKQNENERQTLIGKTCYEHASMLYIYCTGTSRLDPKIESLLMPTRYTFNFLKHKKEDGNVLIPSHALVAEFFKHVCGKYQYYATSDGRKFYRYNEETGTYDTYVSILPEIMNRVEPFIKFVRNPAENVQNYGFLNQVMKYYNEICRQELYKLVCKNQSKMRYNYKFIEELTEPLPQHLYFKNGYYDLDADSDQFKAYSPELFAINTVPYTYHGFFAHHSIEENGGIKCLRFESECQCQHAKATKQLVDYINASLGYIYSQKNIELFNLLRNFLYGDNKQKLLLNLVGPKDSGKTNLCNLLNTGLGTYYSSIINYSFFESAGKRGKSTGGEPTVQVNCMRGKRIVRTNEVNLNRLAGDTIKSFTGNDLQYQRKMYREADPMESPPTFSFIFAGNLVPNIDTLDIQAWQRLYIYETFNNSQRIGSTQWLFEGQVPGLFLDMILNYPHRTDVISNSEMYRRHKCPLYDYCKKHQINIAKVDVKELYKMFKGSIIAEHGKGYFSKHGLSFMVTFENIYNILKKQPMEVNVDEGGQAGTIRERDNASEDNYDMDFLVE